MMNAQPCTVLMEEMTWPEIQAAIERGYHTVLLPAASIEQHGPHLPTGTDTILGYALAREVARLLGNALVAPALRPGSSAHHMDFPGTLTLRFHTFVEVLRDLCHSLARCGFRHVVLFASHGGNQDLMAAYLPEIAREVASRCQVHLVGAGPGNEQEARLLLEMGISREKAGVHAGYSETSVMLAVRPDLVRMDRAEPGRDDPEFFAPENLKQSQLQSFIYGIRAQAANGVLGDPRGATAEAGRCLLEAKAARLAAEIRRLTQSGN